MRKTHNTVENKLWRTVQLVKNNHLYISDKFSINMHNILTKEVIITIKQYTIV